MSRPADSARDWRRFRPHLICIGILVVELVVWAALHRSEAELLDAWRTGDAPERLSAMHVLSNRGTLDPALFAGPFLRGLLTDPDDKIKEFAFTNEICKFNPPPEIQTPYVFAFEGRPPAHSWRAFVLHRRKVGGTYFVGGGLRLKLRELQWFLDAAGDRPVNEDQIREHLDRIAERVEQREADGLPPYR